MFYLYKFSLYNTIIQVFHISNIEIFGFLLVKLWMVEEKIDRFALYAVKKVLQLLLCYVLVKCCDE